MVNTARVFVGYAREDKEVAAQIVRDFENLGLKVYWDEKLQPGPWGDQLKEEVRSADYFIWVMSEHSADSREVAKEYRPQDGCVRKSGRRSVSTATAAN